MSNVVDGLAIHNAIVSAKSFKVWEQYNNLNTTLSLGSGVQANVQLVEVVQDKDTSGNGHSGDAEQGWTGQAQLIFKVDPWYSGETTYWKKVGTTSSYYDTEWDGPFVQVTPKKTEVTYYE